MKWLRNFLYGRYGVDQFGNFLFVSYLICIVLSWIFPPFVILSYILVVYCLYRMLSKQYYKRRAENDFYLNKTAGIRKFLRDKKISGNIVILINI